MSINEITPLITTPLLVECLNKLVQLVETTVKHNATSALLVIGIAIMLWHYRQIVNTFGGFPIVFACGPTETGKLTYLKAGLSLTGGQKNAFYANGTKKTLFP